MRKLTKDVIQGYTRTMKQAISAYKYRSDGEVRAMYETLKLPPAPPTLPPPLFGKIIIPKHAYDDNKRFNPKQEKMGSKMKDEDWDSFSCIFGWPMRGIWPEDSDGTDVNACARSNGAEKDNGLLVTADDFGKVKLFRWPCIVPRAQHRPYTGHSSHVTNVSFTHQDNWLISTGGQDRAVFQWQVVPSRGAGS